MGYINKNFVTKDHTFSSSNCESLSETMLFTTMNIIGLPVDVHVKDGSVYSGIFYTASIDAGFGVVLKQARMTKQGKGSSNVGKEALVDTLVVLSDDLVQVVAKGVTLPADGVGGNITGDDKEVVTQEVCCSENRLMNAEQVNPTRQAGDNNLKGKPDDCRQKLKLDNKKNDKKIQSLRSGHEIDTCLGQAKAVEHGSAEMTSSPSDDSLSSNNAPASDKATDQGSERSTSADSNSTHSTLSEELNEASNDIPAKSIEKSATRVKDRTKNAKEFKLNPAAKIFSPSFVYHVSATSALPTAPNMVYMPSSSPPLPVASSGQVKVSQYGNLTVENAGSGSQISQPIVGQLAHRTQPLQYAAHYTPVLSEPAYLQQSSPSVMVGRSTQLVYVQPASHDLVHGVSAPFSTRPMLNHLQYLKHQVGSYGQPIQVVIPPSVIASLQQHPFAIQSQIPVLQQGFSIPRPISVPGPNGFYGNKFS